MICCSHSCPKSNKCGKYISNLSDKYKKEIHNVEPLAEFGTGSLSMDKIDMDWWCGPNGNYKMFEPIENKKENTSMQCSVCGCEMTNTIGGNYHCPKCGFAVNDLVYRQYKAPSDGTNITINPVPGTGTTYGTYKNYKEGWVCPKCGSVMSPDMSYCLFCSGFKSSSIISGGAPGSGEYINVDSTYSISNACPKKDSNE